MVLGASLAQPSSGCVLMGTSTLLAPVGLEWRSSIVFFLLDGSIRYLRTSRKKDWVKDKETFAFITVLPTLGTTTKHLKIECTLTASMADRFRHHFKPHLRSKQPRASIQRGFWEDTSLCNHILVDLVWSLETQPNSWHRKLLFFSEIWMKRWTYWNNKAYRVPISHVWDLRPTRYFQLDLSACLLACVRDTAFLQQAKLSDKTLAFLDRCLGRLDILAAQQHRHLMYQLLQLQTKVYCWLRFRTQLM